MFYRHDAEYIETKSKIVDGIDTSEDLKNNAEGVFKLKRESIYWFSEKNNTFVIIIKVLLSIIILIEFLMINPIQLKKSTITLFAF